MNQNTPKLYNSIRITSKILSWIFFVDLFGLTKFFLTHSPIEIIMDRYSSPFTHVHQNIYTSGHFLFSHFVCPDHFVWATRICMWWNGSVASETHRRSFIQNHHGILAQWLTERTNIWFLVNWTSNLRIHNLATDNSVYRLPVFTLSQKCAFHSTTSKLNGY